ncbi:MAG: methane monooxygenase/ammonia monooxygenase subunit B [Candidatus Nitrosocaldaceae archaeon]
MKIGSTLLLASIVAMIVLGISASAMEKAWAHGVQAQLQSRFVEIANEKFDKTTVRTGEILTVTGEFRSLVNRDLRAWASLFNESANSGNRWEFVYRSPPGNVFDIPALQTIKYEMRMRALEAGTYHVHTQLNVAGVGPGLGPGETIFVDGPPIGKPASVANIIYQTILILVGYGVTFATRPWQVI